MAQQQPNADEVVLGQEIGGARVTTLNRPRQLNGINDRVVYLLAQFLEKWEKDDDAKLVIFKGAGRAFSAGGDLKMFYEGKSDDSCSEVVYRMYWLCYHIHTYKKTTVALVNGLVMGGGAAMVAPLKFAVVTEKTVFATPEASVGLHTDCSFSYIHSRLPGYLGEYLALTGARLNAKEMISIGLATHFVNSEKLEALEKRLLNLNTGDESAVRAAIEEFSTDVQLDEQSILNKLPIINKCFSAETVEDVIKAFESEASTDGNQWIVPVLKGMRRSSPTAMKITLRSIREGRRQSLPECLKKEFRLTMNILRSVVTGDVYEGIRALSIDKDNAPKWNPATLEEVKNEDVDRVFQPFSSEKELHVPSDDSKRKDPNYKRMVMACFIQAVYLLELDRQDQKGEEDGLAPKWWKPFKYRVTQTLVDERDGSIYGAVLEWDRSSALSDFILIRPSGAPRVVLALRGTLLQKQTMKRDLQDDLRFLVWESLKGSVRFNGALEALKAAVEKFGSSNVCVAGHSLGAGFALQVCKELAKQGVFVECHLFNPPSVSLAMGVRSMSEKASYLWKKVKASLPLKEEATATLGDDKEEASVKRRLRTEKKWVPHLYVNNSDYICCHYNAPSCPSAAGDGASDEQKQQRKASEIAGDVVAKLFVTSKGPQKFLEAHGLQQWWSDGMELQLALYDSKLINRQLKSVYTSVSSPAKS